MLKPTPERIAIHDASAFEAMRRAGRLAAECLDVVGPEVTVGARTEGIDHFCETFIRDHGGRAGTARLSRLSQGHMHFGQPRGLPRHTREEAASGGRYPEY